MESWGPPMSENKTKIIIIIIIIILIVMMMRLTTKTINYCCYFQFLVSQDHLSHSLAKL